MSGRQFVPAVVLGLGVLLIAGVRPQHDMPPRLPLSSISREYEGLPARDVEVSEEEQRVAGMSEYVMREYVRDSGVAFSIYVGYYSRQVQGQSIHSPRNCLPGAGWDIMSSSQVPIGAQDGSWVNRVLIANGSARAMVYYWYQGRGRVEPNEYVVKWHLLRDAASSGRTEEALVRVIVPLSGASAEAEQRADSTALRVVAHLENEVTRILPQWN
jgi:EpsI family protein